LFVINAISSKGELTTNEPIEFYGSITLENEPLSGVGVTADFGGRIESAVTDEYGDFNIRMRSPTVPGSYNVVLEAEYEGLTTQSVLAVTVK
jgi:hypothetical protein